MKYLTRICCWCSASFSRRKARRVAYGYLNFKPPLRRSDIITSTTVLAIESNANLASLNVKLVFPFLPANHHRRAKFSAAYKPFYRKTISVIYLQYVLGECDFGGISFSLRCTQQKVAIQK